MAFRSSAWALRSVLMPNTRSPATRAAMPPTAPDVRAMRRISPNRLLPALSVDGRGRFGAIGWSAILAGFQLVDEARDHVQAAAPEGGVGGVEAEGGQQFAMLLGAAGAQHVEVFGLETGVAGLKNGVEGIHQAVAESVGVDIERRMDEVRNVGPEDAVVRGKLEDRAEAFGLHLQPDFADALGEEFALPAFLVDQRFETVEGDLAHHRVQHVLDLAGEHDAAAGGVGLGIEERAEGEHFAEDAGGFGKSQRRAGHQVALFARKYLVHAVAEFVGEGHDVAGAAVIVHQDVGVDRGDGRMGESAAGLAWAEGRVDPAMVEEAAADFAHGGVEVRVGAEHAVLGLRPGDGGIEVAG